jgi:hypothetical protein
MSSGGDASQSPSPSPSFEEETAEPSPTATTHSPTPTQTATPTPTQTATPTPTQKTVTISSGEYVGQDYQAVRSQLNAEGLSVNPATQATTDSSLDGKVISHDSGTFQPGQSVQVTYYEYTAPAPTPTKTKTPPET